MQTVINNRVLTARKFSLYHYSQACFNKQRPPSWFLLSPRLPLIHSFAEGAWGKASSGTRRSMSVNSRVMVMIRCNTYLEISVSRPYGVAIQVKTLRTGQLLSFLHFHFFSPTLLQHIQHRQPVKEKLNKLNMANKRQFFFFKLHVAR